MKRTTGVQGRTKRGRKRAAAQERVTATVKMTYTDDPDLIAWWHSVPLGTRNAVMKDMLRDYIERNRGGFRPIYPRNQPVPFYPQQFLQLIEDAAWIRSAISELPGYVERIVEHVAANGNFQPKRSRTASRGGKTVDEHALRRREAHIRQAQW